MDIYAENYITTQINFTGLKKTRNQIFKKINTKTLNQLELRNYIALAVLITEPSKLLYL